MVKNQEYGNMLNKAKDGVSNAIPLFYVSPIPLK